MRCKIDVFFGGFRQFSADFGHPVYFGLSSNRSGFVSQKLCQPTPRNISSIAMTTCVNCGSQFLTVKGKKGSKRSLHANLDSIERTANDVLEEEFGLTLTPRQKET